MQKKQLWFIFLIAAILIGGCLLRLNGVTDETRITWDEHRPDIEKFFERPVSFMIYEMEHSLGRPGLNVLRLATLFGWKILAKFGVSGIPEWILFTIIIDLLNIILIMIFVRRYIGLQNPASGFVWIIAGVIWATSPILIDFSHRFDNPVYVLFVFNLACCVFLYACDSGRIRWYLVSGLIFGGAFLTYPGLYHELIFTPVLLFSSRIKSKVSIIGLLIMFCGFVAVPFSMQITMWGIKIIGHPEYYTYFEQLLSMNGVINAGVFNDVPIYPFLCALQFKEYWFAVGLPIVGYGLISRKTSVRPFCLAIVLIYCFWCINGTLLKREVLYTRLVVLVYPFFIIGACGVLAELLKKKVPGRLITTIIIISAFLLSYSIISSKPFYRIHVQDVQRHTAEVLGTTSDNIIVMYPYNDYGHTLVTTGVYQQFIEHYRSLAKEYTGKTIVVAFNLRAPAYDSYPRFEFGIEPLLRYPAQGDGGGRKGRYSSKDGPYNMKTPSFNDIKVFRAEDILEHPVKIIYSEDGNQGKLVM